MIKNAADIVLAKRIAYDKALDFAAKIKYNETDYNKKYVKLDKLHTIKKITEDEFKSKFKEMKDGMEKKFNEYLQMTKEGKI